MISRPKTSCDGPRMTRPARYLIRMAIFILAVAAGAGFAVPVLARFFLGNPAVNGVIVGILVAGINLHLPPGPTSESGSRLD